ncbi:MAG TPA: histidine kinase [Segeticoccus sp.]|jgi:signal transduction histidine kinase|nr:histidine kinase [Segeticoccus sp.]
MTAPDARTPPAGDVWHEMARPRSRQLAFDVVVAVPFAAVGVLFGTTQSGTSVAAAGLLALALVVRRLWWVVMVCLALAAALLQLVSGDVNVPADLAYAVLFFTVGGHPDQAVRRFGLACAGVAVVVAGAWTGSTQLPDRGWGAVAFASVGTAAMTAVVVHGGWGAGYLRWQRRQAIQARVDTRVEQVERRRAHDLYEQEQERGRIAADMHDVVAHSWAVVAAQSDGARYLLRSDPEQAEAALAVIGDTARSAMSDVRRLLAQLRDQDAGAGPGPERTDQLVERMRAAGMDLRIGSTGTPASAGLVPLTAQRVLTEALTNALKHGDLSRPVLVDQDWSDGYRLRVENHLRADGAGGGDGHGLRGMTERVELAGGCLAAGPASDRWVVRVTIPAGARS